MFICIYLTTFQGFTDAIFSMSSELYVELDEVYACADEINVYLQDFTNWAFPIFPIVPGCPQPEFDPGYFVDAGTGYDWKCVESMILMHVYILCYKSWALVYFMILLYVGYLKQHHTTVQATI